MRETVELDGVELMGLYLLGPDRFGFGRHRTDA